jgi:hypothetical protein
VKFADGLRHAGTPFSMLCADDDVVFPHTLPGLVAALETGTAVAAHGRYLGFESEPALAVRRLVYDGPARLETDPLERLSRFFGAYEAVTYAACRTGVLREALEAACGFPSILFRELVSGALIVARGPVIRVAAFTHARHLGPSHSYEAWHPLEFAFDSPGGLVAEARQAVASLAPLAGGDPARAERVLSLALLAYVASAVSTDALAAATKVLLAPGGGEANARATLWARQYSTGQPMLDRLRGTALWHGARGTRLGQMLRRIRQGGRRPETSLRSGETLFEAEFLRSAQLDSEQIAAIGAALRAYARLA